MKKVQKAFTLIELLAIIVILAIIAIITVPIILNIIDNSKRGSAIDSAYGYKDSVQNYYLSKSVKDVSNELPTAVYDITELPSDFTVSGQEPNEGWLKLEKGKVSDYSLKFGDYVVTYDSSSGTITVEKSENVALNSQNKTVSFAEDSWEQIKENLQTNRNFYEIGSEKEVEIDGTSYTVRLANTSSCPTEWTGSETACGVVIEFIDIISKNVMHSSNTNEGGWPVVSMYDYLNTTIFNKLPDALKSNRMIINTRTISGHGSQSGATNYTSTNDKLYLLSSVEILGSNYDFDTVKLVDNEVAAGTRQLEYYVTHNSASDRIKNSEVWWLRSARSNSVGRFLVVKEDGDISYSGANNTKGVAPAFRILP